MTVEEIVGRAAYEVGDETFQFLMKDEYLRMFRRVYRDFALRTYAVRNTAFFLTTTDRSYALYGTTPGNYVIGDNLLGFWRVEYNGKKAYERDFETVKNAVEQNIVVNSVDPQSNTTLPESPIIFSISYIADKMWIYFGHTPNVGDQVNLYYFEVPRLTDVVNYTTTLHVDNKYLEDLVLGLVARAYKRLMILAAMQAKGLTKDLVNFYKAEYTESRLEWNKRCLDIRGEVDAYKDQTTPTVMEIATSFEIDESTDYDDLDTIDYSGIS